MTNGEGGTHGNPAGATTCILSWSGWLGTDGGGRVLNTKKSKQQQFLERIESVREN